MKIFSVMTWLRDVPSAASPDDIERWRRDPLAHPDLESMTSRQLADLPFDRCMLLGGQDNRASRDGARRPWPR